MVDSRAGQGIHQIILKDLLEATSREMLMLIIIIIIIIIIIKYP